MWLINSGVQPYLMIIGVSVFGLFQMCLSCLNGLVLVFAVMSWINPDSPINYIFTRLVGPMLRPIQKVLPLFGGIDLSPLALLALIQIAILILQNLQSQ
jgi:YggT family protein